MKTLFPLLAVLFMSFPAQAFHPMPSPSGIVLGTSLTRVQAALKSAGARTDSLSKTVQRSPAGAHYAYSKLAATFPKGPLAQVKLYFYNAKLARAKFYGRAQAFPIEIASLGKPDLVNSRGRRFWWNHGAISGISCGLSRNQLTVVGRCEAFDMRALVGALGNRHDAEVQYQKLLQSTIERSKPSPPTKP